MSKLNDNYWNEAVKLVKQALSELNKFELDEFGMRQKMLLEKFISNYNMHAQTYASGITALRFAENVTKNAHAIDLDHYANILDTMFETPEDLIALYNRRADFFKFAPHASSFFRKCADYIIEMRDFYKTLKKELHDGNNEYNKTINSVRNRDKKDGFGWVERIRRWLKRDSKTIGQDPSGYIEEGLDIHERMAFDYNVEFISSYY